MRSNALPFGVVLPALALLAASVALAQTMLPYAEAPPAKGGANAALEAQTAERAPNTDALGAALAALRRGDVDAARAARDALPEIALDRHILTWAIALSGDASVGSAEIARASRALPAWPGLDALRRNAERAMLREVRAPAAAVAAFGGTPPETIQGAIVLARAWRDLGQPEKARSALAPLWRSEKLDAPVEIAILAEFGSLLTPADHRARMEQMLYDDRVRPAERVAALAGAAELAAAWGAVIRGQAGAARLLDAVPETQRGAGYLFAKAKLLRRQQKFTQAAAIMLSAPTDRASLVDPDAWWLERRVLSRELWEQGDARTAYALVAAHAAESPAMAADAEFHAGWYALTALGDAQLAAPHFARILAVADGPISRSRGEYWLGRAAEKGGGDAKRHFEAAAAFGATFYGQLAAARLGRAAASAANPTPTPQDRLAFDSREAVAAIRRLEQAGDTALARLLYRDLASELTGPGELALLVGMAEARGDHFLALRTAKIAAQRGLDIGALAHPTGAIPDAAELSTAGRALAYAIARQESEFNAGAVSPAGARGLLQLMPGTARMMAQKSGLAWSPARLTGDAGYNATLGAAFLSDQLDRFAGSYVLTFAGYNAGPRRAEDWVRRFGDPRGKDIDRVVDWIESIPFAETRNYVQRVMENYQVYKMRLSGTMDVATDLTKGRQ